MIKKKMNPNLTLYLSWERESDASSMELHGAGLFYQNQNQNLLSLLLSIYLCTDLTPLVLTISRVSISSWLWGSHTLAHYSNSGQT